MKKKRSYFDKDNYMPLADVDNLFNHWACKYCGAYAKVPEDIVHFPVCTLKEVVNAERKRS